MTTPRILAAPTRTISTVRTSPTRSSARRSILTRKVPASCGQRPSPQRWTRTLSTCPASEILTRTATLYCVQSKRPTSCSTAKYDFGRSGSAETQHRSCSPLASKKRSASGSLVPIGRWSRVSEVQYDRRVATRPVVQLHRHRREKIQQAAGRASGIRDSLLTCSGWLRGECFRDLGFTITRLWGDGIGDIGIAY